MAEAESEKTASGAASIKCMCYTHLYRIYCEWMWFHCRCPIKEIQSKHFYFMEFGNKSDAHSFFLFRLSRSLSLFPSVFMFGTSSVWREQIIWCIFFSYRFISVWSWDFFFTHVFLVVKQGVNWLPMGYWCYQWQKKTNHFKPFSTWLHFT